MKNEIHLIIIWSKAIEQEFDILQDIEKKFDILDIYSISWSKKNFSNNLSRFYGENLPKNSHKEKHCGSDTFTCIVIKDNTPKYEIRKTGKGDKVVNSNLFDAKQLYRSWTGGGHKIHATDNTQESKLQLVLLLNQTYNSYMNSNIQIEGKKDLKMDLVGANGWKSFEEVFRVLNETVNYVILRNFENLEDELDALHPDVDLLLDNQILTINVLNAIATTSKSYRVQYNVVIANKDINFDLRYIGDDYYSTVWSREILKTRIKKNYFYVPDQKNYFYSLLYHALLHKETLSSDYIYRLIDLSQKINLNLELIDFVENNVLNSLTKYMDEENFYYVEPLDLTVYWNNKLLNSNITSKRELNNFYLSNMKKIKNKIKRIIK